MGAPRVPRALSPILPRVHPVVTSSLLGFLVGSMPVAWVVVRLARRGDVSREGSRNVGALNALRVARSKWVGVGVMVLDVLKGAAAVWLAAWIFGDVDEWPLIAAALGAVAGHNYNPWLSIAQRKLVGGKGFAAAAGALLVVFPLLVPAWLGTTLLSWLLFKKSHGITDEAPASAVATLAMIPWGGLLYGMPALWFGVIVSILCLPKIMPELPAVFAEARARRAVGAPPPDASDGF